MDPGMTEWASLRDAYGSAELVPALLAAAEEAGTDEGDRRDDLWSRLCHQGTVYSASYAALPALAEMSQRRPPAGTSQRCTWLPQSSPQTMAQVTPLLFANATQTR